jgi:hypothetical protein
MCSRNSQKDNYEISMSNDGIGDNDYEYAHVKITRASVPF